MKNYFAISRKLFENKLWFLEPFTKAQAWIDLVGNANYKDGGFMVRGNYIDVKRGQLGWSEITMAERWRWSRNKVRRFLKWLESEQQIAQQKLYKLTTIISIINYDIYQNDTSDDTTERQQKDNRKTTDDTQHNKDNKENKDNNVIETKKTLKKEKTYTKENLTIEQMAEKFSDLFKEVTGKSSKLPKDNYNNLAYWLEVYTDPNEIAQAITQIPYDKFWGKGGKGEGGMTPVVLFRRKNPQGEPVDHIGNLLSSRKENYARRN